MASTTHSGIDPALRIPVYFCLFNVAWTYLAALATGNASQVDRVWTFLPTIYTTWYTFYPLYSGTPSKFAADSLSGRAYLLWILQLLWMWRLSYNTWRRGLFKLSEEDYRWEVLRKTVPRWLYEITNFFFIALAQNILLFMLGLPAYQALLIQDIPLGITDYLLGTLAVLDLWGEFVSDNQQWSYQNFKSSGVVSTDHWPGANIQWTENDRKRGFVTRGLWAWSRHPNCLFEQSFWIITAFFPILARAQHEGLSLVELPFRQLIPAIALCGLFRASTQFTEKISKSKYTKTYTAYQKRVGMFLPVTTLVKGLFLKSKGTKEEAKIHELVWGNSEVKEE